MSRSSAAMSCSVLLTVALGVGSALLPAAAIASQASGPETADEVAAKLANPNTPLASLTTKLQLTEFDGELPGASGRSGTLVLMQPTFPFALESGDLILFRPAVPLFLDSPVFEGAGFESESGLGDIAFDLAYARTTEKGLLIAGGIISSLPTATDDRLGTDRFTLGPEFLLGRITKEQVFGIFPNHQWDIGGSGDAEINLTTIQAFYTRLPGGGWNLGTAPIMSYDHEADQWTIPLNLSIGRTVIWNGRPWKLGVEFNYYVEQGDAFGPDWMIGINAAPVVGNVLAGLFRPDRPTQRSRSR